MQGAFRDMNKIVDLMDEAIDSLNLISSKHRMRNKIEEDECDYCDEEGLYEVNMNGHDVMCICSCGKYERLKN